MKNTKREVVVVSVVGLGAPGLGGGLWGFLSPSEAGPATASRGCLSFREMLVFCHWNRLLCDELLIEFVPSTEHVYWYICRRTGFHKYWIVIFIIYTGSPGDWVGGEELKDQNWSFSLQWDLFFLCPSITLRKKVIEKEQCLGLGLALPT